MNRETLAIGIIVLIVLPLGWGLVGASTQEATPTNEGQSFSEICSGSLSPSDLAECMDEIRSSLDPTDPREAIYILQNITAVIDVIAGMLDQRFPIEIGFGDREIVIGEFVGHLTSALSTIGTLLGTITGTFMDILNIPAQIFQSIQNIGIRITEFFVNFSQILVESIDGFISDPINDAVEWLEGLFEGPIEFLEELS